MKNQLKIRIYLCVFFNVCLISTGVAQFDFRLTSSYGNMYIHPDSELNIDIESEKFLTAGIQIDYYITNNFGVGIGTDYFLRKNEFEPILSDYSYNYRSFDNWEIDPFLRNYEFIIRSNSTDIIEQNILSFVEVPVSALYSFPIFQSAFLVTRLGLKMGIPLDKEYVLKSSDLFTRLYFEEWDLELFNIPAHGLYDSRTDWHPEGQLNLNYPLSLFSEIGVDFPISSLKVRLSGYFSYEVNNAVAHKNGSLIDWREDYNYILSLTDHAKLIQLGLKLGVGIISKKEMKTKYKNRITCAWEY